jgi:hypothetical protein
VLAVIRATCPPWTTVERTDMEPLEAQARAIIAAALIVRGAVEIPSMPSEGPHAPDRAGVRLRELTDYGYRLVTDPAMPEP